MFGTKYSEGPEFTHLEATKTGLKIYGSLKLFQADTKTETICLIMIGRLKVFMTTSIPILEKNTRHVKPQRQVTEDPHPSNAGNQMSNPSI